MIFWRGGLGWGMISKQKIHPWFILNISDLQSLEIEDLKNSLERSWTMDIIAKDEFALW